MSATVAPIICPPAMKFDLKKLNTCLEEFNDCKIEDLEKLDLYWLKYQLRSAQQIVLSAEKKKVEKNLEWKKYILADMEMNGWESFVIPITKWNKETGEREEVVLRESVEKDDVHVFADTGKSMSQGYAQCYGKLLQDRNDPIWQDFSTQYDGAVKEGKKVHSQTNKDDKWLQYALGDAQLNGWPSFVTRTTKMDKLMGEKIIEEVLMRESVQREDGVHVFADTKKEMTQEQAKWYSKMLKDNGYALYAEFSELYSKMMGLPLRKPLRIVRKTSAQVEEEKAEEEAKKVREKAEKAAQKAAQKAMEKAAKEALKAEMKKAVKEALKDEKEQYEKESRKKSLESLAKMKNYEEEKKAEKQREKEKAEKQREKDKAQKQCEQVKSVQKIKKYVPKPEPRPAVDPFVPRVGGGLKKWIWNETEYLRDEDNYVWVFDATTRSEGEFKGRYNYEKDVFEECDEPEFEDELDA